MSKLAEKCILAMGNQYDPGPACKTVERIVQIVEDDMKDAETARDFDRLQVLAALRNDLEPYAATCELTKPKKEDGSDSGDLKRKES